MVKRGGITETHAVRLLLITLVSFACAPLLSAEEPEGAAFQEKIQPILQRYCYDCHAGDEQRGDVRLDAWADAAAAVADREKWSHIQRMVERQAMPPADAEPLDAAARQTLLDWIDHDVFQVDCSDPDPGRVTIRRLNRIEYRNTIRDLVGVDVPLDSFPVDPSGHGFDNIGDVLSMPPILLEKYLAAAEDVLNQAIVTEEDRAPRTVRYPLDLLEIGYNARQHGDGWVALTSPEEDDVVALRDVHVAGEYVLRVRAFGQPKTPRPLELTLLLNDTVLKKTLVTKEATVYEARTSVPLGPQRFRVAAFKWTDALTEKERRELPKGKNQEGAVVVEWLEVEGPFNPSRNDLPDAHRKIFKYPIFSGSKTEVARRTIEDFATRAFRRPIDPAEVNRFVQFTEQAWRDGASYERGIKLALTAVLVSPHFLFRGELPADAENVNGHHDIDEYSLATRLSYFLWSSMPDHELIELCRRGQLRSDLKNQVARMLRDDKAQALVQEFAGQWLEIRNIENIAPDPGRFPEFDEALRKAMRRETELLFWTIMHEDRSVLEFLTADYTFVNERLAKHYKLDNIRGDEFQRVSLAGTMRRGVLTQASILAVTSNPTRTSPVKRGKWVLDNLLNAPPPPPPPNVPKLTAHDEQRGKSLRERMEVHRENSVCASCHARMDPIGFALENFDAIGGWRDRDEGAAVDAAGQLTTGEHFNGSMELIQVLDEKKRDDFLRCLTEKMLTYALGRGLEYYDHCAVDRILERMSREDARFSSLVMGIVESVPFQKSRADQHRTDVQGRAP